MNGCEFGLVVEKPKNSHGTHAKFATHGSSLNFSDKLSQQAQKLPFSTDHLRCVLIEATLNQRINQKFLLSALDILLGHLIKSRAH